MKARKKAGTIDVVRFDPVVVPIPPDTCMRPDGTWYVFNRLHNSEINIKIGDFVRIDTPNDIYPIDQEYFFENYEVIDESPR